MSFTIFFVFDQNIKNLHKKKTKVELRKTEYTFVYKLFNHYQILRRLKQHSGSWSSWKILDLGAIYLWHPWKMLIFAPPPFFCLSNWSEFGNTFPAPGRQNLGYQPPQPPPPPKPHPLWYSWTYRLYLVDVSITYHVIATHNSLQLKNNLN